MADEKKKLISVIVPTFQEGKNMRALCTRLFKQLKTDGFEGSQLLFVDDHSEGKGGSEDSKKIVEELQKEGHKVEGLWRTIKKNEPGGGLSGAVLEGFEKAEHATVVCMDADLQHEPETVPALVSPVLNGDAEFTVGSRNVAGGSVGFEWNFIRRLISWIATLLAWPVAGSTDPMSGFFCTTKEVVERAKSNNIRPKGFKIGLELMARSRCKKVKDVPITFKEREEGESKLEGKMITQYAEQLCYLYWNKFGFLLIVFILALGSFLLLLVNQILARFF